MTRQAMARSRLVRVWLLAACAPAVFAFAPRTPSPAWRRDWAARREHDVAMMAKKKPKGAAGAAAAEVRSRAPQAPFLPYGKHRIALPGKRAVRGRPAKRRRTTKDTAGASAKSSAAHHSTDQHQTTD